MFSATKLATTGDAISSSNPGGFIESRPSPSALGEPPEPTECKPIRAITETGAIIAETRFPPMDVSDTFSVTANPEEPKVFTSFSNTNTIAIRRPTAGDPLHQKEAALLPAHTNSSLIRSNCQRQEVVPSRHYHFLRSAYCMPR